MTEPRSREMLDVSINEVDNRLTNILNYINDNPESDPNAYEMNDVMFEVADIGFFGQKFEEEAYDFLHDEKYKNVKEKFSKMMNYRMIQLISGDNDLDCTDLYDYFSKSLVGMATLNRLDYSDNHEDVKNLFNSICGVNLYVHQRIRDMKKNNDLDSIIYDNEFENTKNILGMEDYKDRNISPYHERDGIVTELFDDIQDSYNKTLNEKMSTKKEIK